MSRRFLLPGRQIHLDFHTSPFITDVGAGFDAAEFAATMKSARVNSVTVFAKCHHGHLYFDTKHPARHPDLKRGLNLLGEQVEALHRVGIRAPIYISVQCDEYAADTHPEWLAKDAEGKNVGAGPLSPGWQILDMSSPYQQYLAEQTAEVLRKFKPVDGIFFDMCWDQPSVSNWAVEGMRRMGLNPEGEDDRKTYAHRVALDYMKRFHRMVKQSSPSATVYFNSRPLHNLAEEVQFLEQVEIEALPTGGWGYLYFPKNVRFARAFDRPYLGMTARFHKSWADFGGLKPYAALEYETSQMIAHGARCSIGDQLHPRGVLDKQAYQLIGKAYARIEQREPWCIGATPLVQVGVFQTARSKVDREMAGIDEGATRMLTHLRHQFNFFTQDSDISDYELLILPDAVSVTERLGKMLAAHLRKGGAILATGTSGLARDGTRLLLRQLPIRPAGLWPFVETYIRFGGKINRDVPATDHVMYDRGVRVTPAAGAQSLARVVEPYFQRSWQHFCSHHQTPPARLSKYAAAVIKGRAAYVPFPVFGAYARHGSVPYRLLVRNIIDLLMPQQVLRVGGPIALETSVMRQKGRTIVHLLYYPAERRTDKLDIIEDIVPLADVPMSIRLSRRPREVYLAPQREPLDFDYRDGRAELRVPQIHGHAMVVLE